MFQRVVSGILIALTGLVAPACGGGGGGDSTGGMIPGGGGNLTTLTARFDPDQPTPPPSSVSLQDGASSGDTQSVRVQLTDIDGVYAVSFEATYDATSVTFLSYARGNALESGGGTVNYEVREISSGRLAVTVSLLGAVPAVDVVGGRTLVTLSFRLRGLGSFPIVIQNPVVYDGQSPPMAIPGVNWFAGTLRAS